MIRGTSPGGMIKCQMFTPRVDIYKTTLVVSATLSRIYYALLSRTASRAGDFYLNRRACARTCSSLAGLTACALLMLHPGTARARPHHDNSVIETGTASYYGKAHQGLRTASGQRFDDKQLTAAHHWLPFGTKVRVTLLHTGHSVVVEITDRLYAKRRIVDLSLAAARALGMVHQGVAVVELTPR
jgi:rare lipoprotein A